MIISLCVFLNACAGKNNYPIVESSKNGFSYEDRRDYKQIKMVNRFVNEKMIFEAEPEGEDNWVAFPFDWKGDCDDYAMTKMAKLISIGWNKKRLHVAKCITEIGERHVVLLCEIGDQYFVLDNRYNKPVGVDGLPYTWLDIHDHNKESLESFSDGPF